MVLSINPTFAPLRMRSDENEYLLGKERTSRNKRPPIPGRAVKSIIVSILLVLLGSVCVVCLLVALFRRSLRFNTTFFTLFIVSLLSLPCGIYTLIIAHRIYNRTPGYNWPMIFF